MLELFSFVILLPLFGFLHNGLLWNKLSARVTGTVGTLAVFIPFLITLGAFQEFRVMGRSDPYLFSIFSWIQIGNLSVDFAYQVDQLSLYMTLIITGIGCLIHLYSVGYMKGDSGFNRYFAYLNLFVFSMLNLVLADNLVLTFLGWEGVGLCSYLLIGFDYHKKSSADAGMKAFVVNRIGDFGYVIGMALVYWFTGSLKYVEIVASIPYIDPIKEYMDLIALSFFLAAVGKSAQFPLYVWLPDAMAGPTPVSALIHAATMVTAGIFLIARLNLIYLNAELASLVIACTGAFTSVFAASIAIFQNDIKKILAYSTVSQLGYMFLAMGIGAYVGGMFHLMTHAFFKALLFLGAGSVIFALHHEQDIRFMGGLRKYMKITFITFFIGTWSIAGFPPFSGFFSKDYILEKAFQYPTYGPLFWTVGILSALFTSVYMFRLFFLVFLGEERLQAQHTKHVHESPYSMTLPLILLSIGSAISGFLQTPFFAGGFDILSRYFHPVLEPAFHLSGNMYMHISYGEISHSTEIILAFISVGMAAIGFLIAWKYSTNTVSDDFRKKKIAKFFANRLYVDEIYEFLFVRNYKRLSYFVSDVLDKKGIDRFFLILGLGFGSFVGALRRVQTGFVGDYALYIVLGTIAMMAYVILKGV